VLRRETVIDRDNDAAGCVGKMATEAVMRLEIANDPAAAVKIDEHRQNFASIRRGAAMKPHWNGPAILALRRELADLGDRFRIEGQDLAAGQKQRAGFERRQRFVGWPARQLHQLENALRIAIDRHLLTPGPRYSGGYSNDFAVQCARRWLRRPSPRAEKPRPGKTGASAACRCAGPTSRSASLGDITMP